MDRLPWQMCCAGYFTHLFKNQQGKSWVEHLTREVEQVEMIKNWSSTAHVSGTESPSCQDRGGEATFAHKL
jgi:hypothetical protein